MNYRLYFIEVERMGAVGDIIRSATELYAGEAAEDARELMEERRESEESSEQNKENLFRNHTSFLSPSIPQ